MKLPFDKVYCLHLATDTDRYEYCQKLFSKLGISDQVNYWWTTKRKISNIIGASLKTFKTEYYEYVYRINPTVYGSLFNCTLEQYTIVKQAYERGFENILFMEDELTFIDDIDVIEYVMTKSIPDDYDVLKFISGNGMYMFHKKPYTKELINDSVPYFKKLSFDKDIDGNNALLTNACFALSRNGMRFFIDFLDDTFTYADHFTQAITKDDGLNVYINDYEICHCDNTMYSSILYDEYQKAQLMKCNFDIPSKEIMKKGIDANDASEITQPKFNLK